MGEQVSASEREFIARLRTAVERYLASVDRWEAAYRNYYRLPGYSKDLEAEEREYGACRRELEALLPRARRLCLKYDLREAFSGLLRISLGNHAPQVRTDSARFGPEPKRTERRRGMPGRAIGGVPGLD
jgi:hypothetical protein